MSVNDRNNLINRVLRGSAWTASATALSQLLRLGANLILTRMLYPEAFGLMALVTSVLVGLKMLSDMGISQWIQHSEKGSDPEFLDTAWTIQVARGFFLWAFTCALSVPVARFFNEPMLAIILPVAGIELIISGFMPTREKTAIRNIQLEKVTIFALLSQLAGLFIIGAMAWHFRSVWALAIGGPVSSIILVAFTHYGLKGHVNKLSWNSQAATEIVSFGKWVFLSTICGYAVMQGDRIILGKFLTSEALGIYSIGFFLASFPLMISEAVTRKIIIPLYRNLTLSRDEYNLTKIKKLRIFLTSGILSLLIFLGFFGPDLVKILYDARYETSGAILVLIACSQMPKAITLTYEQAALSRGNSQHFFWLVATKALLTVALMLVGISQFGLVGLIGGQAIAHILVMPAIIWVAKSHEVWDKVHDSYFAIISIVSCTAILWLQTAIILDLAASDLFYQ